MLDKGLRLRRWVVGACTVLPIGAGLLGCGEDGESAAGPGAAAPDLAGEPMAAPEITTVPTSDPAAPEATPVATPPSLEEAPLGETTPLEEAPPPEESPAAEPRLGEEASSDWPVPTLEWAPCGNGFECADALVPRDYAAPLGPQYRVAVTRRPARDAAGRIGALFFNFGGPGGSAVSALQGTADGRFAALNERFDLVAFDPRGTGSSEAVIDCQVDQETDGIYAQPFLTPENLDIEFWTARAQRYVDACVEADAGVIGIAATANVARDMDLLRVALGDEPLSYLGYSYGTFLGATYAALFPNRYRALVLDGAVDPDVYINRPSEGLRAQTAGFERELGRFFTACAADPVACLGFGGDDPYLAYDQLVAEATLAPIPVPGSERALDGDDIVFTTILLLYDKGSWSTLAAALAALEAGDASPMRQLTDIVYGRNDDGSYEPLLDGYFVLGAAEQTYGSERDEYQDGGEFAWAQFDHFFSNLGYTELPYGLFPIESTGVFRGPFVASPAAPPILVVGTTFDPATPYRGAVALVEQLGNARLLTMEGDGHGAYGGNSSCIDASVEAYLEAGTLPEVGAECVQEVPFGQPQNAAAFIAAEQGAPADALPTRAAASTRRSQILYRGRVLEL